MIDRRDIVVVMESDQLQHLRAAYPQFASRFFLLALFEERARGYERYHIADPFGGPRAGYESCYRRIDRAVSNLVKAVQEASRR